MMGYDFKVVYREGSKNMVVDALSRKPSPVLMAISSFDTDVQQRIMVKGLHNQFIDR